ncbi:hypothetical protein [Streptomyces sp. CBMA156]|uniref:hypothetical protein n=1 Tax=Streptomyces sp. CBMA156 TaxID=1930280 RepID=UPI001661B118|nr:hypothetical protein [Streptomyces sp. CBMA156]MBD0673496.1 hypothetical protein [Streptomyces sp. CBMA156]MBD0676963.1 hypothetical protein [Streptomyces sp. CBMA156]
MTDSVLNVVLGLVASAISAGLGWLAQVLRRRRRVERVREFFGLPGGSECLVVVPRSIGTGSHAHTVTRRDAYALMWLAGLVEECGARPELVAHDAAHRGLGAKTELCLGGPVSNERTAAHLAWGLPGALVTSGPGPGSNVIVVGGRDFTADRDQAHTLLARIATPDGGRPVFLVSGQTGIANQAGVRYLVAHHRELARTYGRNGTFALVLRVVNPEAYGPDMVEPVADVTAEALQRPGAHSGAA